MVFTRVRALQANSEVPEAVKKAAQTAAYGASVNFFVFDPALENLKASANRKTLQSNKKATRAFKDQVRAARKELKA